MSLRILPIYFLLFPVLLYSQKANLLSNTEHFDVTDGLADNTVNALLVDQNGCLWVGTENGLNRYLNGSFDWFNERVSGGQLAGHSISCLYKDKQGRIWVGDRFLGLSCYDPNLDQWKSFHNQSGNFPRLQGKEIIDILEDDNGYIWIAAFPDLILRYSPDKEEFIHHRLGITMTYRGITSLQKWSKEELLINTSSKGLLLFDMCNGTYRPLPELRQTLPDGRPDRNDKLYVDSKRNILALIEGKIILINREDSETKQIGTYPPSERPIGYFTPEGHFYVVAFPFILQFNTKYRLVKQWRLVSGSPGQPARYTSFCRDRQGIFWLGSAHGLIKIDPAKQVFRSLVSEGENPVYLNRVQQNIRSVYTDYRGRVWLGPRFGSEILRLSIDTNTGLVSSTELPIPFARKESRHIVNCIAGLHDGKIIMAAYTGLFLYDSIHGLRLLESVHKKHHPVFTNSWAILELQDDDLLIGTKDHGLFRFDLRKDKIRPILLRENNQHPRPGRFAIWNIHRDRQGKIWLATSKGAFLTSFRTDTIMKVRQVLPWEDCSVWDICETRSGKLWLGTVEHGLLQIDSSGDTVRSIGLREGLPSQTIQAVIEDDSAQLWVSTSSALSRIRFTGDNFFIRNFNEFDGLRANGFNNNAVSKAGNNLLFFASYKGVVYFNPSEIKTYKRAASLLVRNSIVGGHRYSIPDRKSPEIILPAGTRSFSLEPALTDYANPEKNEYLYRLNGVDESWKEANGQNPVIHYSSLTPGTYTLQIKATNPDGIPATNTLRIPVYVNAFFWQQTWFHVLGSFFLATLLGFALYLALNRSRIRRKLLKSEIASLRLQMNPHFIFNSLNSIQDYIYHNEKQLAGTYLTRFAKLMRMIMENAGKSQVSLTEEILFLHRYMELESLRLSSRMKYAITVSSDIDPDEVFLPPMLLQPFIENALKHGISGLTRVLKLKILFEEMNGKLTCHIADNGSGFKQKTEYSSPAHRSKGMQVVRDRLYFLSQLENRKYELIINRENPFFPGTGTVITIKL